MNITFTRGTGGRYTISVVRDDGVTLDVPSFDRMFPLPHDLAHFVVERELGLRQGFWGCVAAGAVFPGMKVAAGRRPPHADARSQAVIREAGQHGTEAEVLVGVLCRIMYEGLEKNQPAAWVLLEREWRPEKPARGPVTSDEVRRTCAALRDAQHRWQSLALGHCLTVSWGSDRARARGHSARSAAKRGRSHPRPTRSRR